MFFRLYKVMLRMGAPGRFLKFAPFIRQKRNDPGQPKAFPRGFEVLTPPPPP